MKKPPVSVDDLGVSAIVRALIAEIAAKLERLADQGAAGTIDLRGLPLLPRDYTMLKNRLGAGEVTATVNALGPTRIHETGYSGVWWLTHCNDTGEVVGELIEITTCPSLLISDGEEVRASAARLRGAFCD